MKIGGISKVFNYYEAASKNLSQDIQDWVLTFDEGVVSDRLAETVTANVVEPETEKA